MSTFDSSFDHRYTIEPRNGSRAQGNIIDGGMDTARVRTAATPEEEGYREQVRTDALAYLTRKGLGDIAEILGLTGPAKRRSAGSRASRECPECAAPFVPWSKAQITCSKACGRVRGARMIREGNLGEVRPQKLDTPGGAR